LQWAFLAFYHQRKPVRLTGIAYLIVQKVGVICIDTNENVEKPGDFAGRTSKE